MAIRSLRTQQLLLFLCVLHLSIAAEVRRTAVIFAWPLSAPSSHPLAKITYSYPSLNASVSTYTPPTLAQDEQFVRVGLHRTSVSGSNDWSGMSVPAEAFDAQREKKLQLLVDNEGEPIHIGLTSLPSQGQLAQSGSAKDANQIQVEVTQPVPGPQPVLNKPVVVTQDGKIEDGKEPEKSFFQK